RAGRCPSRRGHPPRRRRTCSAVAGSTTEPPGDDSRRAPRSAPPPAARTRRRRADNRDTCRAWGWRSRTPGSGRPRSRADSLALLRLAAAAEALEQAAEQEAPLSALEDRDETLVDRRIGDEGAEGAFALVDLRGDLPEVGQR